MELTNVIHVDFRNRQGVQPEPETMEQAAQRLLNELKDRQARRLAGKFMEPAWLHREEC